ncbi:uncharacterized protein DNG_00076 [Cephalotrichum gorgonifer]|uniref:Carboxylic ester hydrolase n=1 Tax=Cephalotrichum gorgonifer TaxID=2041049 RepID=A0AAE8SQK5_9PEZI|nr:uncharacterized protein DNG_00076 [Cephalotrichum gorgonifer]
MMLPLITLTSGLAILSHVWAVAAKCTTPNPNLVDLGYAKHIPTHTNKTSSGHKVHIYKNIRFANSPTGTLRFRLPDTSLPKVDGIQDGSAPALSKDCISSAPAVAPFPPYNGTTWGQEDCLFLDVYVPDGVEPGDDVPVLHWFVGSAYAFGSKDMFVDPMGLFDLVDKDTKFIFVANNYRLGVAGWTYLPGQDMAANVGMHDCLAAAEWTSRFIHLFGGDPERVTVMGQSAGAGIINLLTVLNGGEGSLPFQNAITMSPAIPPRVNPIDRQKNLFRMILDTANCTSLDCLRAVPEDTIRSMNNYLINEVRSDAGGGVFGPRPGFGPVLDGAFIPDLPETLYREGKFHTELEALIVGNAAYEGMGTSNDEGLPEAFPALVRQIFPTASNDTVAYIQSHYDFADNPAKLAWDWTTDVIFACNAANVARAYKDGSRRYIFSVSPAIHGQDILYTFYTDQEATPVEKPGDARAFQRNLLDFLHGRDIDWPIYGSENRVVNITLDGFDNVQLPDDLAARCEMINEVARDPENGA